MKIWISIFTVMVLSACASGGDDSSGGSGKGSKAKPQACDPQMLEEAVKIRNEWAANNQRTNPQLQSKGEAFRAKYGDFSCTAQVDGKSLVFESSEMYQALGLPPKDSGPVSPGPNATTSPAY